MIDYLEKIIRRSSDGSLFLTHDDERAAKKFEAIFHDAKALQRILNKESMKTYKVIWEIEIDATTALEAATIAREIQLDPESTATFFTVDGADIDLTRDKK